VLSGMVTGVRGGRFKATRNVALVPDSWVLKPAWGPDGRRAFIVEVDHRDCSGVEHGVIGIGGLGNLDPDGNSGRSVACHVVLAGDDDGAGDVPVLGCENQC